MFKIIYADPPWHFKTYSDKATRSAQDHYDTMSTDDICNLPVERYAADDCALIMWATFPHLEHALRVGKAWGFTYKTLAFIWLKRVQNSPQWFTGMGYYTRSNPEPALLFTRGKPLTRHNKGVHSIIDENPEQPYLIPPIIAPVQAHSAKPVEGHRRIKMLFGDVPRLELFARAPREGWVTLGNAIDGRDIRNVLAQGDFHHEQ